MAPPQKQRRLSTGSASGAEESETVSDLTVARLRAFEEVQVAKQKMRTTLLRKCERRRLLETGLRIAVILIWPPAVGCNDLVEK